VAHCIKYHTRQVLSPNSRRLPPWCNMARPQRGALAAEHASTTTTTPQCCSGNLRVLISSLSQQLLLLMWGLGCRCRRGPYRLQSQLFPKKDSPPSAAACQCRCALSCHGALTLHSPVHTSSSTPAGQHTVSTLCPSSTGHTLCKGPLGVCVARHVHLGSPSFTCPAEQEHVVALSQGCHLAALGLH
jgi:hypothetical protein